MIRKDLENVGDGLRVMSELNLSEPLLKIIVINLKYKMGMNY